MSPRVPDHVSALALSALLVSAGTTHLAKPQLFDPLVPRWLPGRRRAWSLGSGVAEVAVGIGVAVPRSRRLAATAAAALFVAVFPGNLTMAWRWRHRPPRQQAVSLGRLPLQWPLVRWALAVREAA